MFDSEHIPITVALVGGENKSVVNAKDLHDALGIDQNYKDWIREKIRKCGFVKNRDYTVYPERINGRIGRPPKVWMLTLTAAKEIASIENNERAVHDYFYDYENPENVDSCEKFSLYDRILSLKVILSNSLSGDALTEALDRYFQHETGHSGLEACNLSLE